MKMKFHYARYIILFVGVFVAGNGHALSPDAAEGKTLYSVCHGCHNQLLDPPLGPPMWGVQRRYKRVAHDADDFVNRVMAFVKSPQLENAIHDEAVAQLGLMPALPLADEMLKKIALYILEEQFPPPCEHWKIAVRRAENRGAAGHAAKDRRQFERFCE